MATKRGLVEGLRHGAQYPERARWYVRRVRRDVVLRLRHRDHLAYYGAVVDDLVVAGKATAVGNSQRPGWEKIGRMQFRYLKGHGLQRDHRVLEIGCGNLRAGWRLIDFLNPGNYYGVDISVGALFGAQQTVEQRNLNSKFPHLTPVKDNHFAFLPDDAFDVVNAHSVFSHCPLDVIEDCFAYVGRIMKPNAIFDFTFKRTDGEEYQHLHEDYYYRTATLIAAAERHGFDARFMADWEELGHTQSKIRLTQPAG